MSNDIIASIQNQLANIEYGLDEDTKAVAGAGGGSGNKRISIKGGVFRKMVGGKEIASIEDRSMNVIFVKMSHTPSRTYYTGAFKEGEKVSPACWSSDSKVPDPEVKNPPATACDKCPWSVKGSGQGGMGAACRLSWRTAVVLPQDPSGDIMQLVLPATSAFGEEDNGRWPFRAYIKMLANHNISAGRVITKMQFDTKATAPRVLFSPVSGVPAEMVETILAQSKKPAAENAVKLTVYQQDEGGDNGAFPAAPAEAAPAEEAPAPVVTSKPKKAAQSADVADVLKEWTKK